MMSIRVPVIRPMAPDDIRQIVELHLKGFPGFFLTFLGRGFLTLLYQNMQNDPDGIILVACLDGQIQGFAAGTTQQGEFYQRLIRKRKWSFARAALRAVATHPTIIPRLWRALRRPSEVEHSSASACLMSLAVSPEFQGRGIGQLLVKNFCKELIGRRVTAVCLTTDRDHNDRTNRFYSGLGFRIAQSFSTPEGRAINEYIFFLERMEQVNES